MLRFKVVLLSVFAVAAFGAMASASASADSCNGGTHFVFCTSPGNLPITHLAVSGESGLSVLEGKVGITSVTIHCKDDKFAGTFKLLALAEGEIDFLGCSVEKPATCATSALILAVVHIQAKSATTGLATGTKTGGVPEEFTSVALTGGSCAIAGNYAILGLQEVEFPKGGEGLVEHEIVAKKTGSKLMMGEEPASFRSTAKVHLDSNEAYLIMAGE